MPPRVKLPLIPPLKGYSEVTAYAAQPEGTSPAVRNVMLNDPGSERFRVTQRAGTGKYTLFDFDAGSVFDPPDIELPADGTGDDGGPTINLPRRDCYTVTMDDGDSGLWDLIVSNPDNCGPTTIQVNGDANTSDTPITGTITVTGPGGTTVIGVSQPGGGTPGGGGSGGGGTGGTGVDDYRPYIAVYTCIGHTFAFWVEQEVLSNPTHPNALVALREDNICYKLTGQRSATANPLRDWRDFTIFETCIDCAADKNCFYVFKAVFNCATNEWNNGDGGSKVTYENALCAIPADVATVGSWFRGTTVGDLITYWFYVAGDGCDALGDCTDAPANPADPDWPADPDFTPACAEACGPCDLYVGQTIEITRPTFEINGSDPEEIALLAMMNSIPATMEYEVTAVTAGVSATAEYAGAPIAGITFEDLALACDAPAPDQMYLTGGSITATVPATSTGIIIGNGEVTITTCASATAFTWVRANGDEVDIDNPAGTFTVVE